MTAAEREVLQLRKDLDVARTHLERAARERDELRERVRTFEASDERAAARKLDAVMANAELLEDYRNGAWFEHGEDGYKYYQINPVEGDYWDTPPGWPEGIDPREYVAKREGLVIERVVPRSQATPAVSKSQMHAWLEQARATEPSE